MESGAIAAWARSSRCSKAWPPRPSFDPEARAQARHRGGQLLRAAPPLRALGGFDVRFTSSWDDARDLQFTLAKVSGEVVGAPNAIVERPLNRGGWDATLHQYRKMLFDALLFKKHPRLYRERVRRAPPWNYYFIVAALAVIIAGALPRARR